MGVRGVSQADVVPQNTGYMYDNLRSSVPYSGGEHTSPYVEYNLDNLCVTSVSP